MASVLDERGLEMDISVNQDKSSRGEIGGSNGVVRVARFMDFEK